MIQYRKTNACDLNKKLLAQPNTGTSSENWKLNCVSVPQPAIESTEIGIKECSEFDKNAHTSILSSADLCTYDTL